MNDGREILNAAPERKAKPDAPPRAEAARSYYQANREQCRTYARRYYQANRDKCRAASARWRAENPERHMVHRIRSAIRFLEKHGYAVTHKGGNTHGE